MIHEFYAETMNCLSVTASSRDIDNLLDRADLSILSRIQLLAQSLVASNKTRIYAQTGERPARPAGLRKLIKDKKLDNYFEEQCKNFLTPLSLKPELPKFAFFPLGSWALQFPFILLKPYISLDDTDFYILDNPVKKEWVFKVPYVAASQWKGALRATMVNDLAADFRAETIKEYEFVVNRLQLYRLFGNEKDGTADFLNRIWARQLVGPSPKDELQQEAWYNRVRDEGIRVAQEFEQKLHKNGYLQGDIEGFRGSLYFYPTYFDQIDLEVINPHDRNTGAGKLPIYFECVPAGAEGTFTLLYVPLGGLELNPDEVQKQASTDLQAMAAGIKAMMTCYGFGAKTSSGFGEAEVDFVGATIMPEKLRKHWQTAWEESP